MDQRYEPRPHSALSHWRRADGLFVRPDTGHPAALLFLHGFAGTPDQFDLFYDRIPDGIAAYSILLPGHGGTPGDLADSDFDLWRAHVRATLETLAARHEALFLVGHSMGALFALEFREAFPEIRGLFLLQPALRFAVKPLQLMESPARDGASDASDRDGAEASSGGMAETLRAYLSLLPDLVGLYGDALHVRHELERVTIPCRIFLSAHDELLSQRLPELLERIPGIRVRVLPTSAHHLYSQEDRRTLQAAFDRMTAEIPEKR